jgi:putative FmdB family regulatory protein
MRPAWEKSLPIYEYECTSCAAVTDIRHGFKETTSDVCPTCGGSLKRLFKPAGIVFKGSGFYITDSRKAGDKGSKSESSSSSDSNAKSDSGSKGDSGSKSDSGSKADSGSKSDSGSKPDAAA